MRIIYQEGKLYISLTDDEVDNISKNKHSTVEIPIGKLKVLHEDVSNAVTQYWREVGIYEELQETRRRHNI